MTTIIPRFTRGITRGVTRNLKNYGNVNKFAPVYEAQPNKRQFSTVANTFFNENPKTEALKIEALKAQPPKKVEILKPEPIKEKIEFEKQPSIKNFKNENLNDLFKLLTDNITSKVLIAKILLIFSLASGVYMKIKDKPIVEEEKKEEIVVKENSKIIEIIINFFYNLIEKIKNLELYKTISENFNKFIKLPNINYDYVKIILENINKITDEKIYYQALTDLNYMFSNMITKSSDETKELIYSFKNKIDNYVLHVSTEMKNKAINNFNIFLKLFELPNINRFNLLQMFTNYLPTLDIKLIRYNVKQMINETVKEQKEKNKNLYIKKKEEEEKYETDNISEKELQQIEENLEKIKKNKQFDNYTDDDDFIKIKAVAEENFYDYLNNYFKKNIIPKKKETVDYVYNYFKNYFGINNNINTNINKNKNLINNLNVDREIILEDQILKAEKVKLPKHMIKKLSKSLDIPLNINKEILNDLVYFNKKLIIE